MLARRHRDVGRLQGRGAGQLELADREPVADAVGQAHHAPLGHRAVEPAQRARPQPRAHGVRHQRVPHPQPALLAGHQAGVAEPVEAAGQPVLVVLGRHQRGQLVARHVPVEHREQAEHVEVGVGQPLQRPGQRRPQGGQVRATHLVEQDQAAPGAAHPSGGQPALQGADRAVVAPAAPGRELGEQRPARPVPEDVDGQLVQLLAQQRVQLDERTVAAQALVAAEHQHDPCRQGRRHPLVLPGLDVDDHEAARRAVRALADPRVREGRADVARADERRPGAGAQAGDEPTALVDRVAAQPHAHRPVGAARLGDEGLQGGRLTPATEHRGTCRLGRAAGEDVLVQLAGRRRRVDPQLLGQRAPAAVVLAQGRALGALARQRRHERARHGLVAGVLLQARAGEVGRVGEPAQAQGGLGRRREQARAQRLVPGARPDRPGRPRLVGAQRSEPQRLGLQTGPHRRRLVVRAQEPVRLPGQPGVRRRVGPDLAQDQAVGHPVERPRPQQGSQVRRRRAHAGPAARLVGVGPQVLHDLVDRDGLAVGEGQQAQQVGGLRRAPLPALDERPVPTADLQRAQEPHLHRWYVVQSRSVLHAPPPSTDARPRQVGRHDANGPSRGPSGPPART